MREDILRGVRLFAIVFAAILVGVAAYRMLRAPSDVQGAAPDAPAAETVQPSTEPAPGETASAETASQAHPLVVPEPPPTAPTAPARNRTARSNDPGVPPPPRPAAPAVHTRKAAAPAGKEFEASDTVALPAGPVEEVTDSKPLTPKQVVGYKSLIEANATRPPPDPTQQPVPDESTEQQAKGNRFFRAIGKIFHPAAKKEPEPTPLQPKQ